MSTSFTPRIVSFRLRSAKVLGIYLKSSAFATSCPQDLHNKNSKTAKKKLSCVCVKSRCFMLRRIVSFLIHQGLEKRDCWTGCSQSSVLCFIFRSANQENIHWYFRICYKVAFLFKFTLEWPWTGSWGREPIFFLFLRSPRVKNLSPGNQINLFGDICSYKSLNLKIVSSH